MFKVEDFFNLEQEPLAEIFEGCDKVWEVLHRIKEFSKVMAKPLLLGQVHPTAVLEGPVYVGPGSVIEPHVYIKGPVYIGKDTVIRQGAYLRENNLIGDNCVVGHCTELKGSLLLSYAHAPHFAYVGDSILGRGVNLGAGTKLANFKLNGEEVQVLFEGQRIPSGLRKFGAILGDGVTIGCNAVTAPGTVIGKNSWIYSMVSVRGYIPAEHIVKYDYQSAVIIEKRATKN